MTLLEIGVGGAEYGTGGLSLNLWRTYFPRGTIVGVDIVDKTRLSRGRVHVHRSSQTDRPAMERLGDLYGGFDVIIDDGSHVNEHQIESFEILFPYLKSPGVYIVEDVQTSYWPQYGGGDVGTEAHGRSAMAYFQRLIDGINHAEYLPQSGRTATELQLAVKAIYFEHNLVIVLKGDNTEPSNAGQ